MTRLPFWLFSLIDLAGVAGIFSILTTPVVLLLLVLLPRAGRSRVMVSAVLAGLIGTLRFFPGWGPFIF